MIPLEGLSRPHDGHQDFFVRAQIAFVGSFRHDAASLLWVRPDINFVFIKILTNSRLM
jgi:hypothetical protein